MGKDKSRTFQLAYADAMKPLGRGYGFYDTESILKVRRGMCGYIDDIGQWNHIVDLTDRDALDNGGYELPAHLVKADPHKSEWSPVTSNGVRSHEVVVDGGGGSDQGVGAKVKVEYSCGREFGAVLLCNTPVVREGFQHASVLRSWARANARKILENCPDAREFGFHVVQTTWSSEDVYTNVLLGEQKGVSIVGTVRAGNIAEGNASTSYRQESSAGGWVHPIPMNDDRPELRVLFFKGPHFKYLAVLAGVPWMKEFRGGGDSDEAISVTDPKDETKCYKLEVVNESGENLEDE